jgi:hypothetical protein
MAQTQYPVSQRETYEASFFTRFLWWLSTAEEEIVSSCTIDRNRYAIIGLIVLTTWLFATGCWTYFFSTAVDNPLVYVPLGMFMGFVILCIDRALIKGINKQNRKKFTPLLFRGLLAMTIGIFMAQPAVLYLFDKEIRTQVSIDNEGRKRVKRQQLDSLYGQRRLDLLAEQQSIRTRLEASAAAANQAMENFLKEADGTGGTGKVGVAAIARTKQQAYEKLSADHQGMLKAMNPALDSIRRSLGQIETEIRKEESDFQAQLSAGFLTRVEAMQHLLDSNTALRYRYYLIVALLMLIELMPVIVKSLLPSGSYDEKAWLREELEKEMAFEVIQKEKALKRMYNELSHESDQSVIREFFEKSMASRRERMDDFSVRFRDDQKTTFDQMWEKVKHGILSKQEN